MAKTPREEIKEIVRESLVRDITTSTELQPEQYQKINEMADAQAEASVRSFERYLITEDVKQIILNDVRKELTKTTKLDRAVEVSLIIVPLALSLLLFLLTPLANPENFARLDVQVTVIIALILSILQLAIFAIHKLGK